MYKTLGQKINLNYFIWIRSVLYPPAKRTGDPIEMRTNSINSLLINPNEETEF